jgi:hypothetical protein
MSPNVKTRTVQRIILIRFPNEGEVYAMRPMTREEIEKRMDELARKYVETRDKEIPQELYRLSRELEKIEKMEKK